VNFSIDLTVFGLKSGSFVDFSVEVEVREVEGQALAVEDGSG
jgi:hypothetical protein